MRWRAPEASRSTAEWARRALVVMASHSEGSRLETQMVLFLRWRFTHVGCTPTRRQVQVFRTVRIGSDSL